METGKIEVTQPLVTPGVVTKPSPPPNAVPSAGTRNLTTEEARPYLSGRPLRMQVWPEAKDKGPESPRVP